MDRWIVTREQGPIHFRSRETTIIGIVEMLKGKIALHRIIARYRRCVVEIFPARLRKPSPWIRPTHLAPPNFNRVNV